MRLPVVFFGVRGVEQAGDCVGAGRGRSRPLIGVAGHIM